MGESRQVTITNNKIVFVAILIIAEAFLAGFIAIIQESAWPTMFQWVTMLAVAGFAGVTYLISIYKW